MSHLVRAHRSRGCDPRSSPELSPRTSAWETVSARQAAGRCRYPSTSLSGLLQTHARETTQPARADEMADCSSSASELHRSSSATCSAALASLPRAVAPRLAHRTLRAQPAAVTTGLRDPLRPNAATTRHVSSYSHCETSCLAFCAEPPRRQVRQDSEAKLSHALRCRKRNQLGHPAGSTLATALPKGRSDSPQRSAIRRPRASQHSANIARAGRRRWASSTS